MKSSCKHCELLLRDHLGNIARLFCLQLPLSSTPNEWNPLPLFPRLSPCPVLRANFYLKQECLHCCIVSCRRALAWEQQCVCGVLPSH